MVSYDDYYPDYNYNPSAGSYVGRWASDTASDLGWGAATYAAGKGLQAVPWAPARTIGKIIAPFGTWQMKGAPGTAASTLWGEASGDANYSPTTVGGHARKFVRNTARNAAVGAGLMAAGAGITALPIPGAQVVGPLVMGAGKFTTAWSAADAGVDTISDVVGNWLSRRRQAQQPQQQGFKANMPIYGNAALYGLGGLTGAHLLLSAIPGMSNNSGTKNALALAAALGLGYAGWRDAQNARNNRYA